MFSPTVDMTGPFGEKHILISVVLLFSLSVHPAKNQVTSAAESSWQLFRVILSHPHVIDKNAVTNQITISNKFLHPTAQRFIFDGNLKCSILSPQNIFKIS